MNHVEPIHIYIQGVPKKRTWFGSLESASDFNIKTFTSNHSKKEILHYLFDTLFRQFGETHRVKGCDKYVSLYLIVQRKMAYLLISLNSESIWPPCSPDLKKMIKLNFLMIKSGKNSCYDQSKEWESQLLPKFCSKGWLFCKGWLF